MKVVICTVSYRVFKNSSPKQKLRLFKNGKNGKFWNFQQARGICVNWYHSKGTNYPLGDENRLNSHVGIGLN